MSAAPETAIWNALASRMQTLTLSPALPIAWPNVAFENPTTAGAFLRVNFLPNPAEAVTIPHDGWDRHSGIMQVDVMWPEGEGIAPAMQRAEAVAAHFPRGWQVRNDGVLVQIVRRGTIAPAIQDPPFVMVPVSIRFLSFHTPTA